MPTAVFRLPKKYAHNVLISITIPSDKTRRHGIPFSEASIGQAFSGLIRTDKGNNVKPYTMITSAYWRERLIRDTVGRIPPLSNAGCTKRLGR